MQTHERPGARAALLSVFSLAVYLSRVAEPSRTEPTGPHEPLLGRLSGRPPLPAPPALLSSHAHKVCLYFTSLVLLSGRRGESFCK